MPTISFVVTVVWDDTGAFTTRTGDVYVPPDSPLTAEQLAANDFADWLAVNEPGRPYQQLIVRRARTEED